MGSMSAERTHESCRQLATLSTPALHASHRIASSVSRLDKAAVLLPLNHPNPKSLELSSNGSPFTSVHLSLTPLSFVPSVFLKFT